MAATFDAEALCTLLARLDPGALPELPSMLPALGPVIQPLFRGPNAELLLVRWTHGQATPVSHLGDATMAVRPILGEVELLSFSPAEEGAPRLLRVDVLGPGQIAGIPCGAVHALRAHGPATTLHLCAPPVVHREEFASDWF